MSEDFLEIIDDLLPYEEETVAPEQEAEDTVEEKLADENINPTIKLDYKLKSMEERAALVQQIVDRTPAAQLTNRYLEILGDYVMGALPKDERKRLGYITDNRLITINKHETSFEGLAEKFENGEDGLYNLMTNDKNILLTPKVSITKEDIEEVPGLKELRDEIARIDEQSKAATGKKKYLLKKALIEMRRDQYVLKNAYRQPMAVVASPRTPARIDLAEKRWIDKDQEPHSEGLISFFDPKHVSALLCHYHAVFIETNGRFQDDFYYLIRDFKELVDRALRDQPMYMDIVLWKQDNKTNAEIHDLLLKKHNVNHSPEYISSLWRNKIPKAIAEFAKNEYLIWHFTYEEEGAWKKCSCCGQTKLAHNRFFSKNSTSKDGFYSLCKECRNAKNKNKGGAK